MADHTPKLALPRVIHLLRQEHPDMASRFSRRLQELAEEGERVDASKVFGGSEMGHGTYRLNGEAFLAWSVKTRHTMVSICGEQSQYSLAFAKSAEPSAYTSSYDHFRKMRAILLAVQQDYEAGYLYRMRDLIQADVFDSELEQATELFDAGYQAPAAVIAGTVLETTLRQLCDDKSIAPSTLERMGADLAKVGVINKLEQKQITAWAAVRNSAAHGRTDEYSKEDVRTLIRDVTAFVGSRLGSS